MVAILNKSHTSKTGAERLNKILAGFVNVSAAVHNDIKNILAFSCRPKEERAELAGLDVVQERAVDLGLYLNLLNNDKRLQPFLEKGFTALQVERTYALVEQALFEQEQEKILTRRGGTILSALMQLNRSYNKNIKLYTPSRLPYGGSNGISISSLYIYPIDWLLDFYSMSAELLNLDNGLSKYKSALGVTLTALTDAYNSQFIKELLSANKSFKDAILNRELEKTLLEFVNKSNRSRVTKYLKATNPNVFGEESKHAPRGKNTLSTGKKATGAYWIYKLSSKWFDECQKYINLLLENEGEVRAQSAITRLTKLGSAIEDHKIKFGSLELVKKIGLSGFFQDEAKIFKQLSMLEDNRVDSTLGELLNMYNILQKKNFTFVDFIEHYIAFDSPDSDSKSLNIILTKVHDLYPSLCFDIKQFVHFELNRADGETKQIDTTFGIASTIKSIFLNHTQNLSDDDKSSLARQGATALIESNAKIIKTLRFTIKQKYIHGEFTIGTAKAYQSALGKFSIFFGAPEVKSHNVSNKSRRSKHDRLNAARDLYTLEEIARLTCFVEKALAEETLKHEHKVRLYIARVLIKTGWNLAPVLQMDIDDILEINAPITGKSAYFIRLFKKRAGYQTQFYEFEMQAEDIAKEGLIFGKEVTNAKSDLEYMRDKLCEPLRQSLPDGSKVKFRLALVRNENGTVEGISYRRFSQTIDDILKPFGCDVPFNTQKIRKGGLNHIYKKVARNFKKYQRAGYHSIDTFMQSYLRDDSLERDRTLARATEIMGDYFNGRPISHEVTIVTGVPRDTKKVPNGRCASTGGDDETVAYANAVKRLNRDSGTTSTHCLDFNACLFCKHYRVIADAEHVWRLLSYQEYVVGEMQRGVTDYSNSSDQQEVISILNARIEKILCDIAELEANAISRGKELYQSRGCHPDWKLVASIG
tara:strand:- start:13891 stop:16677 length:2787 start_codon:yes stop_codon:yes gene_type:complete